MTVYIDSFIVFNFAINYLLFSVTGLIMNNKTKRVNKILGSIICVLYSAVIFIRNNGFLLTYPVKILFSMAIVYLVYRNNSIYNYLRTVIVFYVVTFVFGGCMYALISRLNLALFVLSSGLSYALITVFASFYKKLCVKRNAFVNLEIVSGDETFKLTGLNDTGNSLYDPYTKLPVIIVSKDNIKAVNKPLRLIPYSTVGKVDGLLPTFTPDKVRIDGKPVEFAVAITEYKLSYDDAFDALINPEGSLV